MPIILLWNTLSRPREAQFKRWLTELNVAGLALGKWLEKRLAEGEALERDTRRVPVLRFYNLALTVRIGRNQHNALLGEPGGLGASLASVGGAWRYALVDAWSDRVREAGLIGTLLRILREMTEGVLASIDRFRVPGPAMFDPSRAQPSDLVGLGALAFRIVGGHREGILEAGRRLAGALAEHRAVTAGGAATLGGEGAVPAPPALPLALRLDEGLRIIAAALLALPAAGALVLKMAGDLLVWIRRSVIETLFDIEQRAFDFRRDLLLGLYNGLTDASLAGARLLVVARDYALGHLSHAVRFVEAYVGGLGRGIGAFAGELETFWNGVHRLVIAVMQYTTQLMHIDIGDVLHRFLLLVQDTIEFIDDIFYGWFGPKGYDAPAAFPLTIADLALGENNGPRARLHIGIAVMRLRDAILGIEGADIAMALAKYFGDIDIMGMVRGFNALLPRLGRQALPLAAQPVLVYEGGTRPDLVADVIAPLEARLTASVTSATNAVRLGTEGVTAGLMTTLDRTADTFAAAASNAAGLGSIDTYRDIVAGAERLTARAFPTGPAAAPTGLERVGHSFAEWLTGGFDAVGGVVGGFVGLLLEEWMRDRDTNEDTPFAVTPTSPRKLLERARLGRVHLPRLKIAVGPQASDAELARRVAEAFRDAVRDAYLAGEARLATARAAAPAAP